MDVPVPFIFLQAREKVKKAREALQKRQLQETEDEKREVSERSPRTRAMDRTDEEIR